MQFDWDPLKAKSTAQKHGFTFEDAQEAFDDPYGLESNQFRNNEERFLLLARLQSRIAVVVYTERETPSGELAIRIISARYAERHEERRYYAQF